MQEEGSFVKKRMFAAAIAAVITAAVAVGVATAATIVVTPDNAASFGWDQTDNRGAGTVAWTESFGAPSGLGSAALQLTTGTDNADKAFIATDSVSGSDLAAVSGLSYWTFRETGPSFGAASLQLTISTGASSCTTGESPSTTLVYEPYWNTGAGAGVAGTVPSAWTQWQITPTSGVFWSSKTTCGGELVAGHGGAPFYTLSQVQAAYPSATMTALGVNVGTYNPSYDVGVDGVAINAVSYDFEQAPPAPTAADQCKSDGWQSFGSFKNQGDCVSFVMTQKHLG